MNRLPTLAPRSGRPPPLPSRNGQPRHCSLCRGLLFIRGNRTHGANAAPRLHAQCWMACSCSPRCKYSRASARVFGTRSNRSASGRVEIIVDLAVELSLETADNARRSWQPTGKGGGQGETRSAKPDSRPGAWSCGASAAEGRTEGVAPSGCLIRSEMRGARREARKHCAAFFAPRVTEGPRRCQTFEGQSSKLRCILVTDASYGDGRVKEPALVFRGPRCFPTG